MLRWLLACMLWLVCAGAQAESAILIVGDSLSAGFGIAQEQSWPALLGQRMAARQDPHAVINISISGETTSGGLSRLAPALRQHRPDIVIIALGANDGLRGLALEAMRRNLSAMIEQCRASHARVLLLGMKLPPNYGLAYAREFEQVFSDLAHRYKLAWVPFMLEGFAERREAFQSDGLHPTAAAQSLLLDNVWRGLQPLLRKP